MANNFFKDLFWGPTPENKEEATRLLNATNTEKSAINFYNIIEGDSEVNSFLSPLKQILQLKWKSAEAHAKNYGIQNNTFTFSDPRSVYKEKFLKWAFKSTVNAAKGTPRALKNAVTKTTSGMKFTGNAIKNQYNKDFSSFPYNKPAETDSQFKLQIEKNQYLNDIGGVPTGQAVPVNNGLSNSSGVSDALIKIQQNIPSFNFEALAALGNLGNTGGSLLGTILGSTLPLLNLALPFIGPAIGAIGGAFSSFLGHFATKSTSLQYFPCFHNGGVVPGQGEIPALLKGGETVRTKAQEEELKQLLYDKYVVNGTPTACGESTQPKRQESIENYKRPIHQQITRDDEIFILNLVSDAIQRNRQGLRDLVLGA